MGGLVGASGQITKMHLQMLLHGILSPNERKEIVGQGERLISVLHPKEVIN
jgi:hypothetical protein